MAIDEFKKNIAPNLHLNPFSVEVEFCAIAPSTPKNFHILGMEFFEVLCQLFHQRLAIQFQLLECN